MQLPIHQIDAFTNKVFHGNPAAVIPLEHWLPDTKLRAIAEENNLPETAFFVPKDDDPNSYHLRWFTPRAEVDLCGHATLATAFHIFTATDRNSAAHDELQFETRSGLLTVTRRPDGRLCMNFPTVPSHPHPGTEKIADTLETLLGHRPQTVLSSVYLIAVFENAREITQIQYTPFIETFLDDVGFWGLTITAPAEAASRHDYIARFFAPKKGVPEDSVTGSAHCALAPYWAQRLNRTTLEAAQMSLRGGTLTCELLPQAGETPAQAKRVNLIGTCTPYLSGTITVV